MSQDSAPKTVRSITTGPLSLFAGVTYPLKALWVFLNYPQLRQFVVVPILLNLLVGFTVYAGLLYLGFQLINFLLNTLPQWIPNITQWNPTLPDWVTTLPQWHLTWPTWLPTLPQWHLTWPTWLPRFPNWQVQIPDWVNEVPGDAVAVLLWLLRLVFTVLLLVITGFIFLQFGVLLGAPWYGKLSEELEKIRTGKLTYVEVGLTRDIGRALQYELKKLFITATVGLPLLIVGFIPGFATIATIGWIVLTATIICFDFFDAPLERRRLSFRRKFGVIVRSLPASASFALVSLGLISIPLINLLAIPLCVAGGTLFVCDRVLPWLDNN